MSKSARRDAATIELDLGTALKLLDSALARRGADFVYQPVWVAEFRDFGNPSCRYARDGVPDGIVGHVLADAGVSPADLEALRDDCIRDLYRTGRLPIGLTLGACAVLHAAQRAQDRGRPWAEAVADAQAMAVRVLDLVPDLARDLADAGRSGAHGRSIEVTWPDG
jgi:hypothetical protein